LPLLATGLLACASAVNGNNNTNGNVNHNVNHGTDGGGALPIGSPCSASRECTTNLCLVVGQEFLCAQSCESAGCPSGTYCARVDVQSAPAGESIPVSGYYCLPDRGGLCKACGSDINCTFTGDRCLDLGNGQKVCGRDCTKDSLCPVGYECKQGQCWPVNNTCDCIPQRVGATRVCQNLNTFGVCRGTESCAANGWEGCTARVPTFEVCNGIDDDCNGELPSDELDANGNGTIDCLDNCQPQAETCNAKDDDCNQIVDDGDPVEMCGAVANGVPECLHGDCVIASCNPGWKDLDGELSTGCECEMAVSGGPTCAEAEAIGSLSDVPGGQQALRTGILQDLEEVWYVVDVVDTPDSTVGACDGFHFRIRFTRNPGNVYRLAVYEEQCTVSPECNLTAITEFAVFTNFRDGSGTTAVGECPCSGSSTANQNLCSSQSMTYLVRVFRIPGQPLTCDSFELELTNGAYPAPI
jgi:hypothetical protein